MQEYKITGDKLKELNDLICSGYEIDEINTCMGYAEIKLKTFEIIGQYMYEQHDKQKIIMLEAI